MTDSLDLGNFKSLEDVINSQFCYSVFPEGTKTRFIPEGHIERIITRDAVILEFFEDKTCEISKEDDDLVNYVVNSAKKLLTISLICGISSTTLKKAMTQFKADNFSDDCLPLLKDITEYPECFNSRTWSNLRKSNFEKEQWSVFAPIFPRKFKRLDLEEGRILPFTWVASQHKEGFFGSVYQVTIHSAHQEDPMLRVSALSDTLRKYDSFFVGRWHASRCRHQGTQTVSKGKREMGGRVENRSGIT